MTVCTYVERTPVLHVRLTLDGRTTTYRADTHDEADVIVRSARASLGDDVDVHIIHSERVKAR